MNKPSIKKGFGTIKAVLGLVLIIIIGGTGLYLYHLNFGSQLPTSSQTQPFQPQPVAPVSPQAQPVSPAKPNPAFDIETFYKNIQLGMTPDEVIKLAGKQPDDCASTGSIPPSETCFWNIGSKSVTVSYGNKNAVQAKNKTGF